MPDTQYPDIFRSAVDPPGPQITCGNVMEIGDIASTQCQYLQGVVMHVEDFATGINNLDR